MNVGTTPVLHTPPPPDSREVNYENTDRYKDGYPGKVKVSGPQTCQEGHRGSDCVTRGHQTCHKGSPNVSQGVSKRGTRGPQTCHKGSPRRVTRVPKCVTGVRIASQGVPKRVAMGPQTCHRGPNRVEEVL